MEKKKNGSRKKGSRPVSLDATPKEIRSMSDKEFSKLLRLAEKTPNDKESLVEKFIVIRYNIKEETDPRKARKLAKKHVDAAFEKLKAK